MRRSRLRLRALPALLGVVASLAVFQALPAAANDPANTFTADGLPTWQTNGVVWGMAAAQGKIFAGGKFTAVRPPNTADGVASAQPRTNLAVLDAATGVPTSCALNVTGGSAPIIRSVVASPDGSTVYVGGLFTQVVTSGGTTLGRANLAAIDVATCSVLPFNPAPSGYVYGITVTSNTVYFGGSFTSVGGQTRSRLGAATTAGTLLPWAPTTDDEIFALATDPNNGNVILGGRMNLVNGQDSHALAVVNGSTGTTNVKNYPQPFFPYSPGTGQRNGTSVIKTIVTDSTGFYVGAEGTGTEIFDGRAAFNWGGYDQRWRDSCYGATQALVADQGTLFAGSHSHNCESEGTFEDGARHYLSAESTTDKQPRTWWPNVNGGIGEGVGPRALALSSSSAGKYLWTGGEFTQLDGVNQQGLTRFAATPDTAAPEPVATPNVSSTVPGQVSVTWRSSKDNDDRKLTYTVYRGSSTTPIATLQANSDFYFRPQLSYTDTGLKAGSSQIYRIGVSDGTNTASYSPYRTAVVAGTANAYPNQVKADGASVYFRMEEPTGTAAASLGTSDQGGSYVYASTRQGQAGALVGSSDTSASFDGTSSFLRTEVRQPAPTVYSTEMWFKTTSTSGGKLIGYGNRSMLNGTGSTPPLSTSFDRHVYMANDGTLTFGTQGTSTSTVTSKDAYNDGQWHYLVATQGASGMALWVDANRVAFNSVTSAKAINGFWRIGGDAISTAWPKKPTSNYFAGNIDEAAVYPTVLSRTQIANHYALSGRTVAGTPTPTDAYGAAVANDSPELYWRLGESSGTTAADSSGNTYTGAYSSTGVTRGVAGAVSGTTDTAIATNGSTGSVASNASAASPTVFSEELWFKTTTTTGGKLIGFGNAATGLSTSYDKQLYLGDDGKVRFGVYTTVANVLVSPTALNNGVWHHVVGVQDSTGQKLYVDGAAVASNAVATNQSYTGYWRVGGDAVSGWPNPPTSKYVNGQLDEVAVYLRALTPAQVSAHRSLGIGQAAPDTQSPTAPASLTAAANGADVALTWAASTDNAAVTNYAIYRSATAGFVASPETKIADVASGVSYTDAGRPPGSWRYLVLASDAAGNISPPSNEAAALTPDTVPPTAVTDLRATASGSSTQLAWTAATDDTGVSAYQIHRSTTDGFNPSAATKIAQVSTTTAVDTPGSDGAYFYKVVAVDAAGNAGQPSNQAGASIRTPDSQPPTAPAGLTGAVATDDVTLNWTAATDNVAVTGYQVYRSTTRNFTPVAENKIADVTATTFVDRDRPAGRFFYRVVAVDAAGNSSALSNQREVLVDLAAPTAPSGVTADVDVSQVHLSWTAAKDDVEVASYAIYRSKTSGFTPTADQLVGTVTDTTWTDDDVAPGSYFYVVVATDAADKPSPASAQAAASVVDTKAPSAPTQLTATVSDHSVKLTWSASTDNVAVTSYRVYRSTTSGFTPGSSTSIDEVDGTGYTDAGRPTGTFYYSVIAVDAKGNTSEASNQASAAVAPVTKTVTLVPTADTYANQGAPTTNFGTSSSMASRGGSAAYTGYLKFAVPSAPANSTLTSAKLQVRTTTESIAGSVDPHSLKLTSNSWTETGLTWNNKPALGSELGKFAGGSATNSPIEATLDPTQLADQAGGDLSLGVTSAGTDNLWFWTRSHGSASYRPTLVLTYEITG